MKLKDLKTPMTSGTVIDDVFKHISICMQQPMPGNVYEFVFIVQKVGKYMLFIP